VKQNVKIQLLGICILIAAVIFSSYSSALPKPESPPLPLDALSLEKNTDFFDEVYVKSGVAYSNLNKVYIEDASLSFDKKWLKEFKGKVSPTYTRYVEQNYTQLLQKQLQEAFSTSGQYQIVESAAEANLIVTPQLTNLYINGPELYSMSEVFVDEVGRGKFELTLKNSRGEIIAKLIDKRQTRSHRGINRLTRANRARNYRDFKFLMGRWSKESVEYLAKN